ncbi:MAG: hypothetical protein JOY64_22165 [Alphaproteobacteria bacterium]|nr:hypothetical protein [Alphaproteobacteria bacterium]
MRFGTTLAVLAASTMAGPLVGPAAADSPRYRPVPATSFTYRLMVTVSMGSGEHTAGQIYRVTTAASDAATIAGTVTPLALVWLCPQADTSITCKQAQLLPDSRREDDLVIAPMPADVSAALGKIGRMTVRDLLHVTQVYPFPGLKDASETVKPQIAATPVSVQTTALDCDEAAMKSFFPLGAVAQATVPCKMTVEVAQSRLGPLKDGKQSHDVSYDLSFAGHERRTVPAGTYDVALIKFKSTGSPSDAAVTEGEWLFIESLGVSAKYSAITRLPNSSNSTYFERELIKVEP